MRNGIAVTINATIDANTLRLHNTRGDLLDLIKELDLGVGDWEFTESLFEHFAKLHEQFLVECAEDAKFEPK
jgi:hypothetical protein